MKIVKKTDILPPAEGLTPGLTQKSRVRREALRSVAKIAAYASRPHNDPLPAIRMEYRPISELREPKRKLRKAIPALIAQIGDSIGEFGLCKLITVAEDGEIIDGVSTIADCKARGLMEVPCLIISHLAQRDRRRLRIALNRIQEKGVWDIPELQAELAELAIEFEGDLHVPGIEYPEQDILLQEELKSASNPLDLIPDKPSDPVSRRGDVWEAGKHILACGDARDRDLAAAIVMKRPVRLAFPDFPYNRKIKGHVSGGDHHEFPMASGEMSDGGFSNFLQESLQVTWDVLVDGALTFAFMDWRGASILENAARKVGFSVQNIVIWVKPNGGQGSLYRSRHEFIYVLKKGMAPHTNNISLGKHGRWRSNVWEYDGASSINSEAREALAGHPTPKPLALLEDGILDVSLIGDLIYDGFSGSGSTLLACENTGRIFCGTELDEGYVDLSLLRWMKLTGGIPRLRETGESFDEVLARRAVKACSKIDPELTSENLQDDNSSQNPEPPADRLPEDGTP